MRKKVATIFASLLVFVGLSHLFEGIKSEDILPKENRVTFIAPFANRGYWGKVAQGVVSAGESCGVDVKCIGFRELNQEKQIACIKSAICAKVDGIITAGMKDTPEMLQAIQEARDANIPVVLVDSDLKDSARNSYVGTDNYKAGKLAGESMVKACEKKGKVLVIVSDLDNMNQSQRVEGFTDALLKDSDIKVVKVLEGQSNEIYLQDKVVRILEENPDIRGVFCAEGYSTSCMTRLKTQAIEKYENIEIVGFDSDDSGANCLKEGILYALVQQTPEMMGIQAMEALKYAESKKHDYFTDVKCLYQNEYKKLASYTGGDVKWHIY